MNNNKITRRQVLLTAAAGTALVAAPSVLRAQASYPNKNVRIIVPFPAGGTTDMLARLFAQRLGETMGQTFLVENVGGGGGSIGAEQVARAPADGYTLLFHNLTFSTTTSSLQYAGRAKHDIEKDFVPISVGAYVPMLLLAHPSTKVKNLKEFVAFAKETKDPLFYGSTGPGSVMNLIGELLKRDASIKMDHVPFRGAAPLVQELLSGRIQLGGDQLSTSLQHAKAGSLTPIAVHGEKRSPALPDVPTVRELGFPNLELQGWNGFFAPAGTPPEVVAKLGQEITAAAKREDIAKKMIEVGAEPSGSSQAEMREMLKAQVAKVKPVVEELKLVVQ
ncbi:tripartite tricarboxylate transporter family receptor [Variibacter gotjawalensis]|uniref:Tripartite tricarboxylate transporter family receptor n=1 Tax=Variibacter gotjawalensis TaxID=1333996 RepID=A0A0S3PWZ5_9BRAD|nr:tripartite tricarboxylate transporter substrate binding protein [Variibacter gotjawalensis]NIK46269.1 tripartite-type tricarboxylate transporter receptor subunit TctC [Variibacter gotjawalensis]RZS48184.1 tripartite-type tricarboxylate transporter receptor subunit TctC [Variibacter gotjawalensis]BAT60441.1 tripartite tricarboxylate transporter family receptor [Variibacter gotjawalensis]